MIDSVFGFATNNLSRRGIFEAMNVSLTSDRVLQAQKRTTVKALIRETNVNTWNLAVLKQKM